MLPHTALKLKERKSNTMRDFQSIAGPLGVTQLLVFFIHRVSYVFTYT